MTSIRRDTGAVPRSVASGGDTGGWEGGRRGAEEKIFFPTHDVEELGGCGGRRDGDGC